MKDVSSMALALESGAVDLIEQPLDRDFVRFRDSGKFQTTASPFWSDFYYIGSVVNLPPLAWIFAHPNTEPGPVTGPVARTGES
jgi:hypothetical protein